MSIEHVERVLNLKVVTDLRFMRAIRICNSCVPFAFYRVPYNPRIYSAVSVLMRKRQYQLAAFASL